MLWKRTFHPLWGANMANWQSTQQGDVINQMKARAAWRQEGSEHWEHCAAYNLKWSFRWRKVKHWTFQRHKRKRNGSRIMGTKRPLSQESEFKTPTQRLFESRKIQEMLQRRDWQPESRKQHSSRCWVLSETVWAILQVQEMRRMRKTRKMMKKIQSLARWGKMTNTAGWWEQSPKRYSIAWRVLGRSKLRLTNRRNLDGGMRPATFVREMWCIGRPNWWFWMLSSLKQTWLQPHHHRIHVESLWRLLMLSPDNRKCHNWLHDQEVVKWDWVQKNNVKGRNIISPTRRGTGFITD